MSEVTPGDNIRELIAELRAWPQSDYGAEETLDMQERAAVALESRVSPVTREDVIAKAFALLNELDLDSGKVTAPGTAWGSILREVKELLSVSPPAEVEELKALRRWRESAEIVLERIRVGDRTALEVIEIAARDRSVTPGEWKGHE